MKKIVFYFFIFLAFLFFVFLSYHTLDPDFGWHFEMGKYILSHGVPRFDPFSYTMPSFHFIDHEWFTNVILFVLYSFGGNILLSILFSCIAFAAIFLVSSFSKNVFSQSLIFLSLAVIISFFRINPQIISWLLFSVLIIILLKDELWKRFKYVLPLLVLVWVNLHGSFAIAVGLIGVKCFIEGIEQKKLIVSDVAILLLSCCASFINPYGPRIWQEVWSQMTDTNLHWEISEWKSPLLVFDIVPWIFYAISGITFWKFRKALTWSEQIIFLLMFLLSLSAERHLPLFTIVSLYVLNKSLSAFQKSLHHDQRERLLVVIPLGTFLCLIFFVLRAGMLSPALLHLSDSIYPKQAVIYLKDHPTSKNIFTVYQWGGYFLWQMPGKKDFIDGRMPSWRRTSAPKNESTYAMKEYESLLSNPKKNLPVAVKKYSIEYLLVPTSTESSSITDIILAYFHIHKKPVPGLYDKLISESRKLGPLVYHDSVSRIYRVTQPQ